jgi:hypothetical protein
MDISPAGANNVQCRPVTVSCPIIIISPAAAVTSINLALTLEIVISPPRSDMTKLSSVILYGTIITIVRGSFPLAAALTRAV